MPPRSGDVRRCRASLGLVGDAGRGADGGAPPGDGGLRGESRAIPPGFGTTFRDVGFREAHAVVAEVGERYRRSREKLTPLVQAYIDALASAADEKTLTNLSTAVRRAYAGQSKLRDELSGAAHEARRAKKWHEEGGRTFDELKDAIADLRSEGLHLRAQEDLWLAISSAHAGKRVVLDELGDIFDDLYTR